MELFETLGGLNQYDFEARMFTPQTCFFRTPDPKAGSYPWLNPYPYEMPMLTSIGGYPSVRPLILK